MLLLFRAENWRKQPNSTHCLFVCFHYLSCYSCELCSTYVFHCFTCPYAAKPLSPTEWLSGGILGGRKARKIPTIPDTILCRLKGQLKFIISSILLRRKQSISGVGHLFFFGSIIAFPSNLDSLGIEAFFRPRMRRDLERKTRTISQQSWRASKTDRPKDKQTDMVEREKRQREKGGACLLACMAQFLLGYSWKVPFFPTEKVSRPFRAV